MDDAQASHCRSFQTDIENSMRFLCSLQYKIRNFSFHHRSLFLDMPSELICEEHRWMLCLVCSHPITMVEFYRNASPVHTHFRTPFPPLTNPLADPLAPTSVSQGFLPTSLVSITSSFLRETNPVSIHHTHSRKLICNFQGRCSSRHHLPFPFVQKIVADVAENFQERLQPRDIPLVVCSDPIKAFVVIQILGLSTGAPVR